MAGSTEHLFCRNVSVKLNEKVSFLCLYFAFTLQLKNTHKKTGKGGLRGLSGALEIIYDRFQPLLYEYWLPIWDANARMACHQTHPLRASNGQ